MDLVMKYEKLQPPENEAECLAITKLLFDSSVWRITKHLKGVQFSQTV